MGVEGFFGLRNETSIMLPLRGANNSLDFTDWSLRTKSISNAAETTVRIKTDQSKWYGSSAYFDSAWEGYLNYANHDDFNLSTSDFTINCWFRRKSPVQTAQTFGCLVSKRLSGADWDYGLEFNTTQLRFAWGDSSGGVNKVVIANVTLDEFHTVKVERIGSALYFYYDGQLTGTATIVGNIRNRPLSTIMIGRSLTSYVDNRFMGWINDFQIVKHVPHPGPINPELWGPEIDIINDIESRAIDLRGIPQPNVTLFDWHNPVRHRKAVVDPEGHWTAPMIARPFGVYYKSQDNRCPPIVHGPYEVTE